MATLEIEGRRVQVDDSFLKLPPEQQSATVDEIAASFKSKAAAKPETPSTAASYGNAAEAGARGAISGISGALGDLTDLGAAGIGAAGDYISEKLGVPKYQRPTEPGPIAKLLDQIPRSKDMKAHLDKEYGKIDPVTGRGEKFVRTAVEFGLGGAGAGAGRVRALVNTVAPAVVSETAGQVTEGTRAEPVARFLGALAGSGAAALASRPGTASRSIADQLPEGITEPMVIQADRLMQEAAGRGVQLAWPEALSQVAGRPVLTNMMRHLEASPQTEGQMAAFFGERPQRIEGAVRQELGNIAPINQAPSTIGPAVGRAAEGTIDDVRGAINRTAEPFYRNAENVRLTPAEMQRVEALPGYPQARDAVRNDPQLNRYVSHLPDDSVGFLNEVKKQLDQAVRAERSPINIQGNQQRAAGLTSDAAAVRQAGQTASPDYATALGVESFARERYLQPLLDGPLGKIASRDTTTKNAIDALFPKNPLANSQDEISTTVSALAHRNQRAARDLVRAHAESTFNQAARDLQTGPNQANGAKFRAAIAGNPQQSANLQAAVEALPNGAERWQGFNRLLDVLEATGARQGIGSRTAYNAEINKAQGAGGLVRDGARVAANPTGFLKPLADKYDQWKLGRNLGQLATILTDPNSAGMLRAIARAPANSGQINSLALRLVTYSDASRSVEQRNK